MKIIHREHEITRKEERRATVDIVKRFAEISKRSLGVELANTLESGKTYTVKFTEVINKPDFDQKSNLFATVKVMASYQEVTE